MLRFTTADPITGSGTELDLPLGPLSPARKVAEAEILVSRKATPPDFTPLS